MKKFIFLSAALFSVYCTTSFAGSSTAQYVRTVYSVTPVTTSAYVQLVASLSQQVGSVSIFDSCGQTLVLAIGASGSEVDQMLIPPGGGGFPLNISSGQRVSIKAISANCNAANTENDINLFYQ